MLVAVTPGAVAPPFPLVDLLLLLVPLLLDDEPHAATATDARQAASTANPILNLLDLILSSCVL
jgi:hypothetical protein